MPDCFKLLVLRLKEENDIGHIKEYCLVHVFQIINFGSCMVHLFCCNLSEILFVSVF